MILKTHKQRGFSLVEIILAIAIFGLSVMGFSTGLVYGQQSSLVAVHRNQAVWLASEGIEASKNIASEDFNNLVDGDFGLSIAGNSYIFDGTTDSWDIYERHITISSVDTNTKKVESYVLWSQGLFDEGNVDFETYITNWK